MKHLSWLVVVVVGFLGWQSVAAQKPAPTQPAQTVERATPAALPSNATETVYVTRTGAKYHRDGCRHLSRSRIPMTLKEAAASYGACSVCRPPALRAASPAAPAAVTKPTALPRPAAAASTQCQATTKKGTQCSRRAQPGRSYCWQH